MKSDEPHADLRISRWPEWPLIDQEYELLKPIMQATRTSKVDHLTILFPLLGAIAESTATLRELVRRYAIRDAYVVARVIYETAINACFILTNGSELAKRIRRHATQKVLRDLERNIELAGEQVVQLRWSGSDLALADPANQALLQEFSSRSGREITSWTPENVKERLESIYQNFGREAAMGLVWGLLLYRHASEVAHGTLYGALFAWGAMDPNGPPKSTAAIQSFRVDQARLLLMLVGVSLESLVRIVAGELSLPHIAASAQEIGKAFTTRP
jgi:hypothetical protein